MAWVCMQFVIVVFPDHTHLLFFYLTLTPKLGNTKAVPGPYGTGPSVSVVECLIRDQGLRVRASPVALCCVLEPDTSSSA